MYGDDDGTAAGGLNAANGAAMMDASLDDFMTGTVKPRRAAQDASAAHDHSGAGANGGAVEDDWGGQMGGYEDFMVRLSALGFR